MILKNTARKLSNVFDNLDRERLPLWYYNQLLIFLCLMGLGLSLYAFTVEVNMEQNKNYKPFCDINSQTSCTKVFSSPYAKGFGVFGKKSVFYKPNSFFGIVFYSMIGTFSLSNSPVAVNGSILLIILSNFTSLYFAYILYFILADLCIVCLATYIVNICNLIVITKKYKRMKVIRDEAQMVELSKKAE